VIVPIVVIVGAVFLTTVASFITVSLVLVLIR